MMSMTMGMIAALPEFLGERAFRRMLPMAKALRSRAASTGRFDDGYDRVADVAARLWGIF